MFTVMPQTPAQPRWFLDNLVYVHVDGAQSGGAFGLTELRGPHGDMPPLHLHERDDETFYVIEGTVSVFVEDMETALTAGQALLASRGKPHTYRVESEQARWLVINNPSGFEEFILKVSTEAPTAELPPLGRPADPGRLADEAAKVGIQILGPPGMLPGQR